MAQVFADWLREQDDATATAALVHALGARPVEARGAVDTFLREHIQATFRDEIERAWDRARPLVTASDEELLGLPPEPRPFREAYPAYFADGQPPPEELAAARAMEQSWGDFPERPTPYGNTRRRERPAPEEVTDILIDEGELGAWRLARGTVVPDTVIVSGRFLLVVEYGPDGSPWRPHVLGLGPEQIHVSYSRADGARPRYRAAFRGSEPGRTWFGLYPIEEGR